MSRSEQGGARPVMTTRLSDASMSENLSHFCHEGQETERTASFSVSMCRRSLSGND